MPFLWLKEERKPSLVFSFSQTSKLDNRYFYSTRVPVHKFLTFFRYHFQASILQYLQRDSHQKYKHFFLQDVVSFSPVLLHITKAALYIDLLNWFRLFESAWNFLQSYLFESINVMPSSSSIMQSITLGQESFPRSPFANLDMLLLLQASS